MPEACRRHNDARRLIAIVESSDDAIFAKDLDGIITNWNTGAERLFGYAKHEVLGQAGTVLIRLTEMTRRQSCSGESARRTYHYETVRQRRNGSLVDLSLAISPIMDANDMIIGVSKIARDITGRRRAQEKQQLPLREINHRIMNLFAVTSSIVRLSAYSAHDAAALAATVRNRLDALARAHALTISANGEDNRPATTLHAVIQTILAPYGGGTNGAAAL